MSRLIFNPKKRSAPTGEKRRRHPCPGKAEGAGAAQAGEEPSALAVPECREGQSRAQALLQSQQWHQSHGQGLSPAIVPAQEAQLLSWAVAALSRAQRGWGAWSLGISQSQLATLLCLCSGMAPRVTHSDPRQPDPSRHSDLIYPVLKTWPQTSSSFHAAAPSKRSGEGLAGIKIN